MINKIRNLFKKRIKDKKDTSYEADDIYIEEDDIISYDDEDATGEVNIQVQSEDTGDLPPDLDEDYTGEYTSNTIDLENDKLPFKDKLQMLFSTAKSNLHRFKINKPKKLQVMKAQDPNDLEPKANLTQKIALPKSFQNAELKLKKKLIKINFKNLHNEFFLEKNRPAFQKAFQYSLIVFATYAVGKTTGLILTGVDDFKAINGEAVLNIDRSNELLPAQVTQIKNANLFKTNVQQEAEGPKKPVIKTDVACKDATKKSRLPIKLVNTVVLQDSVKSIASVQIRSENKLQELRIGEKITGMAQIDKIERQRLIIKNLQDGSCESVENLEDEKGMNPIAVMTPTQSKAYTKVQKRIKGIENDGNKFTIEKSFLKSKMTNIADILTQARGIPIKNPDGTMAFKIVDIEPGGVFAYLGIENNDIITQINGQPIQDYNSVMNLFSRITNIDKLSLTVKRGGGDVPLDYNFKE